MARARARARARHGPKRVGPARHAVPPGPCLSGPRGQPSAQARHCGPFFVSCRPVKHAQLSRPCLARGPLPGFQQGEGEGRTEAGGGQAKASARGGAFMRVCSRSVAPSWRPLRARGQRPCGQRDGAPWSRPRGLRARGSQGQCSGPRRRPRGYLAARVEVSRRTHGRRRSGKRRWGAECVSVSREREKEECGAGGEGAMDGR